jgi:hypothetical protein
MPPRPPTRAPEAVPLWLILILLLFLLAGLLVLAIGLRTAARQDLLTGMLVVAFSILFLAIPSGALALMYYGRRQQRQQEVLQASNPGQPWKWREDFAKGILHPEGGGETSFAAIFALFWNAAALTGAWAGIKEYLHTGDWRFLLVLLFPAFGALFLRWSLTNARRRLRYRNSVFRLDTAPAWTGGRLKGTVLIPPRLDPPAGFDLTLDCLRRARDSEGTQDTVLWDRHVHVPTPVSRWPEAETAIAVSIPIPAECPPWDETCPDKTVVWRLRVAAKGPGADLDLAFEVPVFCPGGDAASPPGEALPDGFMRPAERVRAPASSRIRIEGLPGGAEFIFPPAGGARHIPALLIAVAAVSAAVWAIAKAGAPLVFPLAVGAFGLVPILALYWHIAGEVRLRAGVDGVRLTYRAPGFRKTFAAGPDVILDAGIAALSDSAQARSYGILLRRRNAKPLYVLAMLADRAEAEWAATEINRHLPR